MPKHSPDFLELDIDKVAYSQNGIPDYYWPVSDKTRAEAGDLFVKQLADLILKLESDVSTKSYCLTYKYLFSEFIALFWALSLKQALEKDNVRANVPDFFFYLQDVLNDQVMNEPRAFYRLRQGPKNHQSVTEKFSFKRLKRIFKILDFKKGGVSVGNLKVVPITKSVLNNSIIATQRQEMIERHASDIDEDIVFCRYDRWFNSLTEQEINKEISNKNVNLEKEINSLISDIFQSYSVLLPQQFSDYFARYIEYISAAFRCHYQGLNDQVLPTRLWTGTGGNPWDMMIRLKVMENGGYVGGHDHGAGLAHVNNHFMGLVELWGCNEFFVENENAQQVYEKQRDKWVKLTSDKVKISFIDKPSKPRVQSQYKKEQIKTIMFPPPLYDGDRGRPGPYSSNITYADWQARAISFLNAQGYKVILKIHPETLCYPPKSFEEDFDAVIDDRPFDTVLKEVDMVLIDHLYTSIFKTVLETNIPFVMLDFYDHPWTEHANDMFQKRASLVNCCIDKDNRYSVDWAELKAAIDSAPSKSDHTGFFDFYYS